MKNLFLAGRVLCVILFLAAIIAWIAAGAWGWLLAYLLLHLAEALLFGIRIGNTKGRGILYSFVYTMLFGFFWWFALDRGYID